MSAQVVDVEVDREVEVRITFDDGVTAVFPVDVLREACPCAGCRGRRERGDTTLTTGGQASIRAAELRGNWGISFTWNDGHDTGIYAWQNLREWWNAGGDAP